MITKTLSKANRIGIAYSGTWENEGHSVSYMENPNDKSQMKIIEVIRRNGASSRATSMMKIVSLDEAIISQDKLIKFGYRKMN